ncbi:MAG: class I SAM-dependent methyltransferase [Planctomycetota bacterium]
MSSDVADLYVKKTLEVEWGGRRLALDVPVDVFSSFQVDRGTALLLRAIEQAGRRWGRALDLGCGYGPIALWLAATGAGDEVHAVDRDALAVLFTQRNAARNGLSSVLARGGLAYDNLPASAYDAVVTNLPAKAGEGVHRLMLLGAAEHLSGVHPDAKEAGRPSAAPLTPEGMDSERGAGRSESRPSGRSPPAEQGETSETGSTGRSEVWAVVVAPLEERIDAILADEAVRVLDKARRKEHVVYRYAFADRPALPAEPYRRGTASFAWRGHAWSIEAVHGLAEFDTLAHATEAVAREIARLLNDATPRRAVVWNPGHGHLPILLARLCPAIERLDLVSRDLLALHAARANLAAQGAPVDMGEQHTADPAAPAPDGLDLFIGVVNEGLGVDAVAALLGRVRDRYSGVPLLLGASSSFAARLARALRKLGLAARTGRKRRGACAVLCD